MGSGKSASQNGNEGDCGVERANHPASRKNHAGRQPQPQERGGIIANLPLAVVEHFFPRFRDWLGALKDPRDPRRARYSEHHLLVSVLLMFLTHMKSRRQFGAENRTPEFLRNLLAFSGSAEETLAHPDTPNNFLKKLNLASFSVFCA